MKSHILLKLSSASYNNKIPNLSGHSKYCIFLIYISAIWILLRIKIRAMDTVVNRYVDRGGCSQLVGFISANLNHQTHPAFRSILMDFI